MCRRRIFDWFFDTEESVWWGKGWVGVICWGCWSETKINIEKGGFGGVVLHFEVIVWWSCGVVEWNLESSRC